MRVAALALLLLAGCGRPVEARAARGFVEIQDDPVYDFRAVAPEGVAVAARVVDVTDAPRDLPFWERAVTLRMRELEGYQFVEAKDAEGAGARGRELVFGHDEAGKPFLYRVLLFVHDKKLLVIEAGGSREQMQRFGQDIAWMIGQIRPK